MKHKLIMENWRRFVIKENEEKLKEFYHGTTFPVESFTQGIDASRAKGHGQGSGFYVYLGKSDAINHARDLASGEMFKGFGDDADQADGKPIIVVINPPFTPENFDIDFEAFGNSFGMFVLDNIDYFAQNHQELGIGSRLGFKPDRVLKLAKDRKVQFSNRKRSTIIFPSEEINPVVAANISQTAEKLSELNPDMYRKFEESVLSSASAVKYNGAEKIFPLRIEDLEGNVLWSRN